MTVATVVNGAWDHSNVEITIIFPSNQRHTLMTCGSIDYGNNAEAGSIAGTQQGPVTTTTGSAKPEWSGEIARHEHQQIVAKLGAGYTTKIIQVQVSYRPVGSLTRITDEIVNGRYTKDGIKSASGDPSMVEIGGLCDKVKPNGIDPFNTEAA
jgi:hypothetical protein